MVPVMQHQPVTSDRNANDLRSKESAMKKRALGALEVSAIGLGCMSMSSAYGPAGRQGRDDQAHSTRAKER